MGSFTEEKLSPLNNDPQYEGHINQLNDDCLAQVFQFLPYADRVRVDRVCRHWRKVSLNSWNQYARLHTSLEIGTDTGTFPHKWRWESLLPTFAQILTQRGAYLTKISFAESCRDKFNGSGMLKMVIQYCPMIRKIQAENVLISPSDLKALATCTQIESLGIGCAIVPPVVDVTNVPGYNRLSLLVDQLYVLMDVALKKVFQANKNLRHFTISRNEHPIGSCLKYLEPNVLETLHIIDCPFFRFDKDGIQRLTHSLRELRVHYRYDPDTLILSYVPKLKNLRKLTLTGSDWIMEQQVVSVLHQIARNCLALEHVDLGKTCFMACDSDIGPMLSLPELREFVITGKTNITNKVFVNQTLEKLENLTMPCCWLAEKDYDNLVNRLPKLKCLNMCECGLRREGEWLCRAKAKGISIVIRSCINWELRY